MPRLHALLALPLFLVLGTLGPLRVLQAHEVEMADGTIHEGRIVVDDSKEVIIVTTFDGRKVLPRADVQRIDKRTPPLREQLKHRALGAMESVKELFALRKWAKKKGFTEELEAIDKQILRLDPKNAKAHKALGHIKIDGVWMTEDEKVEHDRQVYEDTMRAKGLVLYNGQWVTPEEKDALERGLLKDGDEYVTEEEYHRRRGQVKKNGVWIKLGEKEGKAWLAEMKKARVAVLYRWGANTDLYYNCPSDVAKAVHGGCEGVFKAFFQTLSPTTEELPKGVAGRVRVHLFSKQPPYARFVKFFDGKEKCSELIKGWVRRAQRQHAFWWVQPIGVVGTYKFPNTTRTVVSTAGHHLGFVLLTEFRFNFRFPKAWLLEGFAYYLEMQAYQYSDTFNVHRGGSAAASASGAPVWLDSTQWERTLRGAVDNGLDPPLARIVRMESDQLGYPELVKSWSVVDWLISTDRKKFRAFLVADKDREKTHDEALKEVYGMTWRQLDQKWRSYVQKTYAVPAPVDPK